MLARRSRLGSRPRQQGPRHRSRRLHAPLVQRHQVRSPTHGHLRGPRYPLRCHPRYPIAGRPPPRSLEKPILAAARAAPAASCSHRVSRDSFRRASRQPSTVTPDAGSPPTNEARSCHAAHRDTTLVETGRRLESAGERPGPPHGPEWSDEAPLCFASRHQRNERTQRDLGRVVAGQDGWRRRESNPQPPPCKGGALPIELRPRRAIRTRSSTWSPHATRPWRDGRRAGDGPGPRHRPRERSSRASSPVNLPTTVLLTLSAGPSGPDARAGPGEGVGLPRTTTSNTGSS